MRDTAQQMNWTCVQSKFFLGGEGSSEGCLKNGGWGH